MTLRAARINAGLTQKQAAKMLNISVDTLRNYEKGRSFPNSQKIKLIESVYSVSYNDLIFLP